MQLKFQVFKWALILKQLHNQRGRSVTNDLEY